MTLQEIEARIRAAFPALAYSHAEFNTYGEDNYVVVLDGAWIARLPRSDDQIGRFAAELNLLSALRQKVRIRVPHYEYVAEGNRLGAYRLIAGREMTPPVFCALDTAQQGAVLDGLAAFLSVLHAMPEVTIMQPDGEVQRCWNGARFAAYYRGQHRAKIAAVVNETWLARFDMFHDAFSAQPAGAARLAHGDLSDDHILIGDDGALAGVIDFTDAAWGDVAIDFGYFWRLGEAAIDRVLASYAPPDAGLKDRARWTFVRYLINQIAYGDEAKWNLSVGEALAELEPHLKWCGV